MLYTIIRENAYMDSLALMVLSAEVSGLKGVSRATVMMGTAANLEIMRGSGFDTPELTGVRPGDMVIVVDADDKAVLDEVEKAIRRGTSEGGEHKPHRKTVKTWKEAAEIAGEFDVCLLSVPGEYAAEEAEAALGLGKHVFLFSDNVSLADEKRLKQDAREKGLLLMGPDCGTAMIRGVPLGFANAVRRGNIGVVGASGTGIQEVTVQIHRMGAGISSAIGTGGRDLSEEVGAITMLDAIEAMKRDGATKVLVVISKPPAARVREHVIEKLRGAGKPAVVYFLGDDAREDDFENIRFAGTTAEAAAIAAMLSGLSAEQCQSAAAERVFSREAKILGLFAGGTLACEAAMIAARAMQIPFSGHGAAGRMLESDACEIIDLGDDCYTRGKPHPMIDGEIRNQFIRSLGAFSRPTILLMDVVLGFGAQGDPASGLADALRALVAKNRAAGIPVALVANLLGTEGDVQGLEAQKKILEDAGVRVFFGNVPAVEYALSLTGRAVVPQRRQRKEYPPASQDQGFPGKPVNLLEREPGVLNVGLRGFADDLEGCMKRVVHYAWKPAAGGDRELRRAIDFLDAYEFEDGPYRTIDEANLAVAQKIKAGAPHLVDVIPAQSVCALLRGRVLLHAGPPMRWEDMTSPMRGSCVGAALFEEWASTEEEAWAMLERGEVRFVPCHHAGFVGPMGGITSGHMPVLKVENRAGGNVAYCTMNEGIGAVLRFGAYSHEVIERLRFLRDTLGPVLGAAMRKLENGLALNPMIAKAIAMGDDFHQRNIAASAVFLREMAPLISELDEEGARKTAAIRFLASTDQFFLNIMMAAAKCVMDDAATVASGTVVTVMSRNGKDFGIRLSGMGSDWFTGPVNTPSGIYFSGYREEDGNPDMGDSAITETFGVGGMAMIAAPAVTKYVGTGGFYDALEISNRMMEISIGRNGQFPIPNWDFKGTCCGIDARKVAMMGIPPVINTGIAHRKAGLGQIGAGTVTPPMECFRKALVAYAVRLGFK